MRDGANALGVASRSVLDGLETTLAHQVHHRDRNRGGGEEADATEREAEGAGRRDRGRVEAGVELATLLRGVGRLVPATVVGRAGLVGATITAGRRRRRLAGFDHQGALAGREAVEQHREVGVARRQLTRERVLARGADLRETTERLLVAVHDAQRRGLGTLGDERAHADDSEGRGALAVAVHPHLRDLDGRRRRHPAALHREGEGLCSEDRATVEPVGHRQRGGQLRERHGGAAHEGLERGERLEGLHTDGSAVDPEVPVDRVRVDVDLGHRDREGRDALGALRRDDRRTGDQRRVLDLCVGRADDAEERDSQNGHHASDTSGHAAATGRNAHVLLLCLGPIA